MIRALVLAGWYALAIVAFGPLGILHAFVTNDISWLYWKAMQIAGFGLRLVGVRIDHAGRVGAGGKEKKGAERGRKRAHPPTAHT